MAQNEGFLLCPFRRPQGDDLAGDGGAVEGRWARSVAGGDGLGGVFLGPDVGQEWREVLGGCRWRAAGRVGREQRQLGQDAGEVTLRVDAVTFGAGDERPEPRVVFSRGVVTGEKPVFTIMRSFA